MTNKELLKQCAECTIDELNEAIITKRAQLKLMEEVKRVRISDGEKTKEMIERARKKAEKEKQKKVEQVKQSTETAPVQKPKMTTNEEYNRQKMVKQS